MKTNLIRTLKNKSEVINIDAGKTAATGKSQPYFCGRNFLTPYLFSQSFYKISGTDGATQEVYNIKEINAPKTGAIAEYKTGENLHVAYMLTPQLALHITQKGCRITHIRALNPIRYYEVIKNESEFN